jgi:2-keto-4-pentenoate hydratase/2-oxohepta-3-ene-1,7-dioic acid hydratase in catechol pathway
MFGLASLGVNGSTSVAVVTRDGVRSLASLLPADGVPGFPASVRSMLVDWDAWCDAIEAALERVGDAGWTPVEAIQLGPPIPDPPAIYCGAATYSDHANEMGAEGVLDPYHFLVAPTSLNGHGQVIPRPLGCEKLDWEVELVAVIGTLADRVDEEQAVRCIAGYTVANDVTVRDGDRHPTLGVDWLFAKSHTGLVVVGPAIVPARYIVNPLDLRLTLTVNGEMRQDATTSQLAISPGRQISHLSHMAALTPGDLVLTGTPAGTGAAHGRYLEDGDEMVASIEQLGSLVNRVVGPRAVASGDDPVPSPEPAS